MKVTKAEMVISAVAKKQYPNDSLPEIALAGRSNVGKSSFINQMIQRRKLARISTKPGKTQTLNFYKINDSFYFVDVPGYGYAQVSKSERNKWGQMMDEFFQLRESIHCVVLITDIRHNPTKADIQMYEYAKQLQFPVLVIGTKADKISKNKQHSYLNRIKNQLHLDKDDEVLVFSAQTGVGKDKAWSYLSQYI